MFSCGCFDADPPPLQSLWGLSGNVGVRWLCRCVKEQTNAAGCQLHTACRPPCTSVKWIHSFGSLRAFPQYAWNNLLCKVKVWVPSERTRCALGNVKPLPCELSLVEWMFLNVYQDPCIQTLSLAVWPYCVNYLLKTATPFKERSCNADVGIYLVLLYVEGRKCLKQLNLQHRTRMQSSLLRSWLVESQANHLFGCSFFLPSQLMNAYRCVCIYMNTENFLYGTSLFALVFKGGLFLPVLESIALAFVPNLNLNQVIARCVHLETHNYQ